MFTSSEKEFYDKLCMHKLKTFWALKQKIKDSEGEGEP